jgi:hypothetical protein
MPIGLWSEPWSSLSLVQHLRIRLLIGGVPKQVQNCIANLQVDYFTSKASYLLTTLSLRSQDSCLSSLFCP